MLTKRIRTKILLILLTVILVVSASFVVYFIIHVGGVFEARKREEGLALAKALAQSAELGVLTEEQDFLQGPFKGMLAHESVIYVVAYGSEGRIIKAESKIDVDLAVPRDLLPRLHKRFDPFYVKARAKGVGAMMDYYAPVLLDMSREGIPSEAPREKMIGSVRVGMSHEDVAMAKRRIVMFGMGIAALLLALTTGVVIVLSRRFTRPLTQLRQGAARVAQGDLDFQIEVSGHDEIGDLAASFNRMTRELRDTTVSKDYLEQARAEVERESSRLAFLLASLNEGVVMFDPSGDVVVANPFARRLLRLEDEERVTRDVLGTVKWLNVDAMLNEMASQQLALLHREVEVDFPIPRVIRVALSQVRSSDERFLGYVMLLQDITEERQIDRMKDEFIETVSHDLRTPLTTIKGFVALLLAGKTGDLSDKQRQFLINVDESAQHLHALINNLLDVSRIGAGKLVIQARHIDVHRLVEDVVNLNKPAAQHKGLSLDADIPAGQCTVEADYDRMKEVLNNLLGNAIKFTPKGGSVKVSIAARAHECEIRVADTGPGIPHEYHEAIFEKFRSIPGQRGEVSLSTGLGLSIVKGIVEAHRGTVRVESEPGQGATFIVVIPKKLSP